MNDDDVVSQVDPVQQEPNPFAERLAAISKTEPEYNQNAVVPFDPKTGFQFQDIDGMFRAAKLYLQTGYAPPSIKHAKQIVIIWAMAAELGIRPLVAINNMSVVNNRPNPNGDLALSMVHKAGLLADTPTVVYSGEGDDYTCTIVVKRKGHKTARTQSFSIRQAKTAKIYGKQNWQTYPDRMLYYRALGFALRDVFPDVMNGMVIAEELEDYPAEANNK